MRLSSACLFLLPSSSTASFEIADNGGTNTPVPVKHSTISNLNRFSRDWWDSYFHSEPAGCQESQGTPHLFAWDETDWMKNIDGLVQAWVDAIATGNGHVAVVLAEPDEDLVPAGGVCHAHDDTDGSGSAAAMGVEGGGWSRIFAPMAHLCVFDSQQDWLDYLAARGLDPPADAPQGKTDGEHAGAAWGQDPEIRGALAGTTTDQVRAMARVLDYVLSHVQPHIQSGVQYVLHEPANAIFSGAAGKYVGMHVRKTEGRTIGNFKMTETLGCFERAFKFLEDLDASSTGYIPASRFTGVCLVSRDEAALPEAKDIVRRYFSNVKSENVVQVSADPVTSPEAGDDPGRGCESSYYSMGHEDALVPLLAELHLMAKADVFVGAASESFGRLVFLMRESLQSPRKTSLSMDRSAPFPGRYSTQG